MSRDEVKSLNDLAMAHGGQLTINPQTGLPEAGFLSSILPMVAGAALTATGIGAPMAAMLVGGGATMMTGSLKKGLMAGLGAYGGAGLGASLMNAGAAGALPAAAAESAGALSAALPEAVAAPTAAIATPVTGASPMITNALPAQGAFNPAQVTSMSGTNFAPSINPTVSGPAGFPATATAQPDLSYMTRGMSAVPASASASTPLTFSENMANMKRGFTGENLMNYAKENPYSAASMAASALMPDEKKPAEYKGDADMGQRYTYAANKAENPFPTPDPLGREQRYFTPAYTKIDATQAKKLYGYAGGGTVEMMSDANAIGANTGFPMADINKGAYATPYQTPISRNVLSGVADTGVNPMTGEMAFADGGVTTTTPMPEQYSYDPLTQMFNKIEAMPSDNQPKVPQQPVQIATGQQPMSDAAFAKQQAEGQKNLQAIQDGTMMSRIGESLSEGLSFMAQNGPTAALINAITGALGIGAGPSSASFSPNANGFNQGADSQAANVGDGDGGGATGGGGVGGGVSTGSGSGGGAAAMGTGAHGMAAGAAGAARGGLMAAYAKGGSHLGDYSDGGRLLRGPGDGVSDSIPAMIGKKQPARLADGEFVVPARIVSELGNGSTEAGARKLYAMMDRVQKARGKTVGKGKVAKNSRSEKYLPA
jgi:hypothetical protein